MTMRVDLSQKMPGQRQKSGPEMVREVDAGAPSRTRRARWMVAGITGLGLLAGFGGGLAAGIAMAPTDVVVMTRTVDHVGPCTFASPAPPAPPVVTPIAAAPELEIGSVPSCCFTDQGCFDHLEPGESATNYCLPTASKKPVAASPRKR
ncbi:MAG TPA: hypothetical protein VFG83_13350 [Kofleriaceae bacterium]|nr:hypothetical protein [Kofleriaceae bacterium]